MVPRSFFTVDIWFVCQCSSRDSVFYLQIMDGLKEKLDNGEITTHGQAMNALVIAIAAYGA